MDTTPMPTAGRPGDLVFAWVVALALVVAAVLFVRRARREGGLVRLVAGNALVTLALLSIVAAGAETWLRHVHDGTTWHAANLVTQSWFMRHWKRNSQGFRDAEWPTEVVPDAPRVLFVGDSFTAGYGIADPAHRFVDLVRSRLPEADVRSIATIGAETQRELTHTTRLFDIWDPTHVVLVYCLNDAEHLLPARERDGSGLLAPEPDSLASRSFLVDLIRTQRTLTTSGHGERYQRALAEVHEDPAKWSVQERLFERFVKLCSERDAELSVVVFPLFSHWEEPYPLDRWHERVLASWRAAGVEPLDLRATYAGLARDDLVVGRLDAHPNEAAHALAADAILRAFFSAER